MRWSGSSQGGRTEGSEYPRILRPSVRSPSGSYPFHSLNRNADVRIVDRGPLHSRRIIGTAGWGRVMPQYCPDHLPHRVQEIGRANFFLCSFEFLMEKGPRQSRKVLHCSAIRNATQAKKPSGRWIDLTESVEWLSCLFSAARRCAHRLRKF